MTTYNYRIMRTRAGDLELVEVYYQDNAIVEIIRQPTFTAYTAGGETQVTIVQALRRAHQDARDKPIIVEGETVQQ